MGANGGGAAKIEVLLKKALDEIIILKAENAQLKQENAVLKEALAVQKKNSSNSSKPPSSDIVKPPKEQRKKGKRKIGAQKGHKQHLRQPFDETNIDQTVELKLDACPTCGGKLTLTGEPPKKHQQVEFVDKPFIVTEFQQVQYWCEKCQCYHYSALPPEVEKSGLFGPKIISLTAYLKGRAHLSYKTLQDFFANALSLNNSTGFLAKQVHKASAAMEKPYQELVKQLPNEQHLHIDETGGKENGQKRWTWLPTNNVGEQAIRRVVIDRKVTQGTRSDWGNRWQERIWSVLATCGQQGINVMSFLNSCIESFLHGLAPPSLVRN